MAAKMDPKLLALCTAAIGIIYTAGYVVTEPGIANMGQTEKVAAASSDTQNQQVAPQHPNAETPSSGNSGSPSTTQPPSSNDGVTFKDGTYIGMAHNRIGAVQVAVTIKSNKITGVEITDCTTKYPQSRIDHLPAQVVERQSLQVDAVTGATKSVQDFVNAVRQALQQAQGDTGSTNSSTSSSNSTSGNFGLF